MINKKFENELRDLLSLPNGGLPVKPKINFRDLRSHIEAQQKMKASTIDLIASNNAFDPESLELSDLLVFSGYAEGESGDRQYPGNSIRDSLDAFIEKQFKDLLPHKIQVDYRLLSGAQANLVVYLTLLTKRSIVMSNSMRTGAHNSHRILLGHFCNNIIGLPWDEQNWTYKVDICHTLADKYRPTLTIFGTSLILHPVPDQAYRDLTSDFIQFDYAHIFGLVLAGALPFPIRSPNHIMSTSLHKTFPSLAGGAILYQEDSPIAEDLQNTIFPTLVSMDNGFVLPALSSTLTRLKTDINFKRIPTLANNLARMLSDLGFDVLGDENGRLFTETHQIIFRVNDARAYQADAEKHGILLNSVKLPSDANSDFEKSSGIRLGIQKYLDRDSTFFEEIAHKLEEIKK